MFINFIAKDNNDDQNISIRSYLMTVLITLGSIYKTIIWFLIIIVAYVSFYYPIF